MALVRSANWRVKKKKVVENERLGVINELSNSVTKILDVAKNSLTLEDNDAYDDIEDDIHGLKKNSIGWSLHRAICHYTFGEDWLKKERFVHLFIITS